MKVIREFKQWIGSHQEALIMAWMIFSLIFALYAIYEGKR